jgi:thiamine kinase-like enzyme
VVWQSHCVYAFSPEDARVSTNKRALPPRVYYASSSFSADDNLLETKWLEWICVSLPQSEHGQEPIDNHRRLNRRISLQPLLDHKGFCNTLCLVQESNNDNNNDSSSASTVAIFKIYSELAKARRRVSGLEDCHLDEYLGELGLGPKVYGSSEDYLLMEYLENGMILNHDVMSTYLLNKVATSLATLHTLKLATPKPYQQHQQPQQQPQQRPHRHGNMLWDSIDVLLDNVRDISMKAYFQDQVERQRTQLERLDLPLASVGHGDLKASNVMCLHPHTTHEDCIRFIDLETAGVHYRAFDVAKFFRPNLPTVSIETVGGNDTAATTRDSQTMFLQTYLRVVSEIIEDPDTRIKEQDVESLRLESELLIPMTWLEAAIFFYASRQPKEWKAMADQRLEQFSVAMSRFPYTLKTFLGQNASDTTSKMDSMDADYGS